MTGRKVRAAGKDARRRRPQRADPPTACNGIKNEESRIQVETLAKNAAEFGVEYYSELDTPPGHRPHHRPRAGLHAARHDHRLRRQPHLDARRLRRARARHRHVRGRACARHPDADPAEGQEHAGPRRRQAAAGVTAKDIILAIIGEIGTAGGTGHVIEYAGEAIRALSMEGRMTVCNMSIEGGARAGLIAPDETTFAYIKGRPRAPKGEALGHGARLLEDAAHRRRRAFRQGRRARRRQAAADRHLGLLARGRRLGHGRRARTRTTSRTRTSAPRSGARSTIWA